MSGVRVATARDRRRASVKPIAIERGLALGMLAMAPLFLTYEIALASNSGWRNSAEFVALSPLRLIGAQTSTWRAWLVLAALALAARAVFDARLGLAARLGRTIAEGFVGALALGPLAFIAVRAALGPERFAALGSHHADSATLPVVAFVVGGAAWEELVFRVAVQSALFVVAREMVEFLVGSPKLARAAADVASIALAAVVFAAAHLAQVLATISSGGEAFDAGIFAWRFAAGAALGVVFRWRGPGVAAWTHAFANLALIVGAGPEVFL